jgi:hypothetical protein
MLLVPVRWVVTPTTIFEDGANRFDASIEVDAG